MPVEVEGCAIPQYLKKRVFRVIKSVFLDYLKKILPYTFDFFGLAELQIMPKDAKA